MRKQYKSNAQLGIFKRLAFERFKDYFGSTNDFPIYPFYQECLNKYCRDCCFLGIKSLGTTLFCKLQAHEFTICRRKMRRIKKLVCKYERMNLIISHAIYHIVEQAIGDEFLLNLLEESHNIKNPTIKKNYREYILTILVKRIVESDHSRSIINFLNNYEKCKQQLRQVCQ